MASRFSLPTFFFSWIFSFHRQSGPLFLSLSYSANSSFKATTLVRTKQQYLIPRPILQTGDLCPCHWVWGRVSDHRTTEARLRSSYGFDDLLPQFPRLAHPPGSCCLTLSWVTPGPHPAHPRRAGAHTHPNCTAACGGACGPRSATSSGPRGVGP